MDDGVPILPQLLHGGEWHFDVPHDALIHLVAFYSSLGRGTSAAQLNIISSHLESNSNPVIASPVCQ